jgi:hypothetical protein
MRATAHALQTSRDLSGRIRPGRRRAPRGGRHGQHQQLAPRLAPAPGRRPTPPCAASVPRPRRWPTTLPRPTTSCWPAAVGARAHASAPSPARSARAGGAHRAAAAMAGTRSWHAHSSCSAPGWRLGSRQHQVGGRHHHAPPARRDPGAGQPHCPGRPPAAGRPPSAPACTPADPFRPGSAKLMARPARRPPWPATAEATAANRVCRPIPSNYLVIFAAPENPAPIASACGNWR